MRPKVPQNEKEIVKIEDLKPVREWSESQSPGGMATTVRQIRNSRGTLRNGP